MSTGTKYTNIIYTTTTYKLIHNPINNQVFTKSYDNTFKGLFIARVGTNN